MNATKIETYADALSMLDAVTDLDDLQSYSAALYASDLLDESEQTTTFSTERGPLAPWSLPSDAEVIEDNGEDVTARLASQEVVGWSNRDRAWSAVEEDDSDDDSAEGKLHIGGNEIRIQHDNSGVGHNWRNIDADEIQASVREEIEGEIFGGLGECHEFVGSNGEHYRWGV